MMEANSASPSANATVARPAPTATKGLWRPHGVQTFLYEVGLVPTSVGRLAVA
jgi:hypothetical protein